MLRAMDENHYETFKTIDHLERTDYQWAFGTITHHRGLGIGVHHA